jgi:signal transduction histidine kinase
LLNNSILHGKASSIEIDIESIGDHIVLRFADKGSGIPDKIKTKIFDERFIFGKSGNTGIGLHIVKNTIERYGWQMFLEDNKSKGATFVIELRKPLS